METQFLSTNQVVANLIYLVSVLCFMVGIMRLGRVKTARSGNRLAAGAMLLAVIGQLIELGTIDWTWILVGLLIGGLIGGIAAWRVQMTEMPEMVALFNGSGGLASTLVALAQYVILIGVMQTESSTLAAQITGMNGLALALTVIVGSVTFTGSVIAWGKLSGRMNSAPRLIPGRHVINVLLLLAALVGGVALVWFLDPTMGVYALGGITALTMLLGIGLVIPIGGGDMPVVISLLNSYSGIAAAMAGFTINSPVLIVSGSMVGAAGLILTQIMCVAMNRSLANVLFGGFGGADSTGVWENAREYSSVKSADPEEAAMILEDARSVIVVPGYGMAVAQAQHAVRELGDLLMGAGAKVRYAVHPVAGRMPGHMNVLLAEADVPYDQLFEMDEINQEFRNTDVAIVLGANDVVNPVALTDKDSPIYGMPILNVHDAGTVFVIKRSLSPGFAGIKNPLFEADNALMLFGDGKKVMEHVVRALKDA
jgi:NAD(P) transhydrogenase subunit beta